MTTAVCRECQHIYEAGQAHVCPDAQYTEARDNLVAAAALYEETCDPETEGEAYKAWKLEKSRSSSPPPTGTGS